jgi:hypothetical protein
VSTSRKLGNGHNDALRGVTTIPLRSIGTDPIHAARLKAVEQVLRLTGDMEPLTDDWKPTGEQRDAACTALDVLGLGPDTRLNLTGRGIDVGRSAVEPNLGNGLDRIPGGNPR